MTTIQKPSLLSKKQGTVSRPLSRFGAFLIYDIYNASVPRYLPPNLSLHKLFSRTTYLPSTHESTHQHPSLHTSIHAHHDVFVSLSQSLTALFPQPLLLCPTSKIDLS